MRCDVKPTVVQVPVDSISTDNAAQMRDGLDRENLQRCMEMYQEAGDPKAKPPVPVVVFDDGETKRLADGFHRVEAARKLGLTTIPAEVHKGGQDDAVEYAAALPRKQAGSTFIYTNAAKRNAVTALLLTEKWVKRSNRAIARHVGVHFTSVNKIRRDLEAAEEILQTPIRTCIQDGKERTMDTAKINEGRKPRELREEKEPEKGSTDTRQPREPPDRPEKPENGRKKRMVYRVGTLTADQAIRLLKSINKSDTERKEGLCMVCQWLKNEGVCCNG